MAIESCNIPLPSEIILPFGGYLVSTGKINFVGATLAGTIGGTVGSALSYYIGLHGGRPFLDRYGKFFGISQRKLEIAESWFERYGEATVFFTRLMPVVRTFISLPAGIARMNFTRFVIYTFLGSLPWSLALTYIGFLLGEHWETVRTWFHQADLLILAAVVIAAIYYFAWRRKRS